MFYSSSPKLRVPNMKLFVCLHNQLGAISRLRYLSESAPHLLSLLVSESIFQLPLPPLDFIYLFRGLGGAPLPGRTWVWKAPRGVAAPTRLLRGPGSGEGALAATADPGGRRWARPETTELPFCLGVLPASSSQSQPQPPVPGRAGRRPARGVHEPLSRSGGPETRDTIRI